MTVMFELSEEETKQSETSVGPLARGPPHSKGRAACY